MARIRRKDGNYSQTRLCKVADFHSGGLGYEQALELAKDWFKQPDIVSIASEPYSIGANDILIYKKTASRFTVGDAMLGFVEWKRIAAAKTYFETTLSMINHHIIPRLGDLPVEDLTQPIFTQFCIDILESPPKRGKSLQG